MVTQRRLLLAALMLCFLVDGARCEEVLPPPALAVVPAGTHAASPELRALQDGLVHLLQSELATTTAARLVSRHHMDLFLEELGMAASQLVEPATAQRFGRAVTADSIVLVSLRGSEGPLLATLTVEDVASGREVCSHAAEGSAEELGALARRLAVALTRDLELSARSSVTQVSGPTPTLAVLDFRSTGDAGELDRHLSDLADLLSANLDAVGIPLVERHRLDVVLRELGLSASGLVRTTDMAKVRRLIGAERILDTTMTVSRDVVLFNSLLINPETGLIVAGCRASGSRSAIPNVLQDLTREVAAMVRRPVTAWGRRRLAQQETGLLEAALHAAAGWRLGAAGRAEEAVERFKQAVYLDPDVAWWWYQLGEQYVAMGDFANRAETIRRSFPAVAGKADTQMLSSLARELAHAETLLGNWAESEAAARLALYYHEDQDGYWGIIGGLAEQGKFEEIAEFCESLVGRTDIPYYNFVRAWDFMLGFLGWQTSAEPDTNDVAHQLAVVARTLDVFHEGGPIADLYLGDRLALSLLSCSGLGRPDAIRPENRGHHLEECLSLARRMTEFQREVSIPSRGWLLTGLLSYKLGRADEAVDALTRCLTDYPSANYDMDVIRGVGPTRGLVHYLLGCVHQDLLRDREDAIAAFQRALFLMDPYRAEALDAAARLRGLGGSQLPPSPWVRSVGGTGQMLDAYTRQQLASHLHGHGYDLRLQSEPIETQLAGQGIQILIWRGRASDYPSAEALRSYVAGGGNLLICLGAQPYAEGYGPLLATASRTFDLSLNRLLPAFGMRISDRAHWVGRAALQAGPFDMGITAVDPWTYVGTLFPLEVPEAATLIEAAPEDSTARHIVAAATGLGLGKVAVVSLRDWFVGADFKGLPKHWETTVFQSILDWFGRPEVMERHPQAAAGWAAARRLVAAGDPSAAVLELDRVAELKAPSADDARYWAACLLADKVGDRNGAYERFLAVAPGTDDPWLVRMANLRLGLLAVESRDEDNAMHHLGAAAGEQPDRIWGQAWIGTGNLRLVQGQYLEAARCFQKVSDRLPHSEERFRALFGLAFALVKQQKPHAAAVVFDATVVEFGNAQLPRDLDSRWPDPWADYYPLAQRADRPRVSDAVAAARPSL